MSKEEKQNQSFMKIIRAIHDFTVRDDLEKYRRSQANIGLLLGTKHNEATYDEFTIEEIPCEWVIPNRPHKSNTIILYCHGGGFYTGSLEYARTLTTRLSLATSMNLLSFNYRLAPEYKAPAPLEDAMKVWNHLMHLGYGAKDIVIAGDSAGGNLALTLGLRLKEEQRMLPRGFVLFSPWTDLTLSGDSHEKKADVDPILNAEYLTNARSAYVATESDATPDYSDPYISPLFGDFTGFPSVYTQVGSNEILLQDATRLHKHLLKQHVNSNLRLYKGMWHVFQMSNMKKANEAVNEAAEMILNLF